MSDQGVGGAEVYRVEIPVTVIDNTGPAFARIQSEADALKRGVTAVGAGVGSTTRTIGQRLTGAGTMMRSFGTRASHVGKSLTRGVTLPILGAAAASLKFATDFQSQMRLVQTQAGGTARDVGFLSRHIMAMKNAQQGPVSLARAMFHLKSVGMGNVPAMRALRVASSGAAVGQADLEETTNALAGAWRSGIRGAQHFRQAMGYVNAIVGAGNMRLTDLVGAIGTGILPAAKTAGLRLQDVGAALATLTDNGMPANQSATRLRMSFALLGAPTEKAGRMLRHIGLSSKDLAYSMQGPRGLLQALTVLRDHLSNRSSVGRFQFLSRAFGGGRSSTAITALMNNLDVLGRKYDQIKDQAGNFGAAVTEQRKTAQAQLDTAVANLQRLGVTIGTDLLPKLLPVVDRVVGGIRNLVDYFSNLSPAMQNNIIKWGLLAAAAGPFLRLLGGVSKIGGGIFRGAGWLFGKFSGRLGLPGTVGQVESGATLTAAATDLIAAATALEEAAVALGGEGVGGAGLGAGGALGGAGGAGVTGGEAAAGGGGLSLGTLLAIPGVGMAVAAYFGNKVSSTPETPEQTKQRVSQIQSFMQQLRRDASAVPNLRNVVAGQRGQVGTSGMIYDPRIKDPTTGGARVFHTLAGLNLAIALKRTERELGTYRRGLQQLGVHLTRGERETIRSSRANKDYALAFTILDRALLRAKGSGESWQGTLADTASKADAARLRTEALATSINNLPTLHPHRLDRTPHQRRQYRHQGSGQTEAQNRANVGGHQTHHTIHHKVTVNGQNIDVENLGPDGVRKISDKVAAVIAQDLGGHFGNMP